MVERERLGKPISSFGNSTIFFACQIHLTKTTTVVYSPLCATLDPPNATNNKDNSTGKDESGMWGTAPIDALLISNSSSSGNLYCY